MMTHVHPSSCYLQGANGAGTGYRQQDCDPVRTQFEKRFVGALRSVLYMSFELCVVLVTCELHSLTLPNFLKGVLAQHSWLKAFRLFIIHAARASSAL